MKLLFLLLFLTACGGDLEWHCETNPHTSTSVREQAQWEGYCRPEEKL